MKTYWIYLAIYFMLFSACVSSEENESKESMRQDESEQITSEDEFEQSEQQNETQEFTWYKNGEAVEKAFMGDEIIFEGTFEDSDFYNGELSYCWFGFIIWDGGNGNEYVYTDLSSYNLKIENGKIKIHFSIDALSTALLEEIKKDGKELSYPLECFMHIITGNGMEFTSNQIPILYVYQKNK